MSLYDILELYILGIFKGAFSYRASAIAFSFFMALFPFALFILNLIPYIPIKDFQVDFINFIAQNVPPNTFEAIDKIIMDILNNSYQGLLSTGFILSIFLMTNGVNAILGGFEMSEHITILIILSSYIFGIYVEKFARYNELYGSIGTLLVLMFYIWINCMVLLLGFELNAAINKLKRKNLYI